MTIAGSGITTVGSGITTVGSGITTAGSGIATVGSGITTVGSGMHLCLVIAGLTRNPCSVWHCSKAWMPDHVRHDDRGGLV